MKFSPNDLHLASSNMKTGNQRDQHNELETSQHEENDISSLLNRRKLSKIILPPLGASNYNQNQIQSKGRIIDPTDSRYRYVGQEILTFLLPTKQEMVSFLLHLGGMKTLRKFHSCLLVFLGSCTFFMSWPYILHLYILNCFEQLHFIYVRTFVYIYVT